MLWDAFIYPKNKDDEFPHPTYLIECDAEATTDLLKHLKKYVLRAKVKMADATSSYVAWQVWGPAATQLWGSYVPAATKGLPVGGAVPKERFCDVGCRDPRHAELGLRVITQGGKREFQGGRDCC